MIQGIRDIQILLARDYWDDKVNNWKPLPHQVPPEGDWYVWLLLGGRGSGKTMAGTQYVLDHLRGHGKRARVGIGAPTIADARDVCAEGVTGLINIAPNEFMYNRSIGEARHRDGGYVKFMGSEEPARWNGPQWSLLWADELALWNEGSWHQAQFGLRLGEHPKAIVTTTPKNRQFVRTLSEMPSTATTRATTFDNPNLSPAVQERLRQQYGGTRIGRQELHAEWLDDVEGALWTRDLFRYTTTIPDLEKVVVAIDPAGTKSSDADETGIVVAGKASGEPTMYYVLGDYSLRGSPNEWAARAVGAYHKFDADRIVAETNFGGEMVQAVIKTIDRTVAFRAVHASRGKHLRAEPIVALYEQQRVYHVDNLQILEDQLCTWTPLDIHISPDRLDALVWALTELSDRPMSGVRFL